MVDISGSDLGNSWNLVKHSGSYAGEIYISGSDFWEISGSELREAPKGKGST